MKKLFFDYIITVMQANPDVYFISAGLGWPRTDDLKKKFPKRFIQTEAAEQTACDIAVGLAYSEKIPFVYTITPFLLRAFETLRTYVDHEYLHVCLVGAGRNNDYSKHDGFSHEAEDIPYILAPLRSIIQYFPQNEKQMQTMIDKIIAKDGPAFISIPK
jgi:transketolase C-terminal domain/subunit